MTTIINSYADRLRAKSYAIDNAQNPDFTINKQGARYRKKGTVDQHLHTIHMYILKNGCVLCMGKSVKRDITNEMMEIISDIRKNIKVSTEGTRIFKQFGQALKYFKGPLKLSMEQLRWIKTIRKDVMSEERPEKRKRRTYANYSSAHKSAKKSKVELAR